MYVLKTVREQIASHFRFHVKLNKPPLGWSDGVGFIEKHDIIRHLVHPSNDSLVVMCGPPIFENAMRKTLFKLGFSANQYYSYSEGDYVATRL
jgi:cytochrome-b5 reductase